MESSEPTRPWTDFTRPGGFRRLHPPYKYARGGNGFLHHLLQFQRVVVLVAGDRVLLVGARAKGAALLEAALRRQGVLPRQQPRRRPPDRPEARPHRRQLQQSAQLHPERAALGPLAGRLARADERRLRQADAATVQRAVAANGAAAPERDAFVPVSGRARRGQQDSGELPQPLPDPVARDPHRTAPPRRRGRRTHADARLGRRTTVAIATRGMIEASNPITKTRKYESTKPE